MLPTLQPACSQPLNMRRIRLRSRRAHPRHGYLRAPGTSRACPPQRERHTGRRSPRPSPPPPRPAACMQILRETISTQFRRGLSRAGTHLEEGAAPGMLCAAQSRIAHTAHAPQQSSAGAAAPHWQRSARLAGEQRVRDRGPASQTVNGDACVVSIRDGPRFILPASCAAYCKRSATAPAGRRRT